MASPSTFSQNKNEAVFSRKNLKRQGFTLIEVLVVIALLIVVIGLGSVISFDAFNRTSARSEKATIVSVLQKARGESLNNINERRHGVHFQNDPLKYILFECSGCDSYPGTSDEDVTIDPSFEISITDPASLPFDVIFEQLSGDCVTTNCSNDPLSITLLEGENKYSIYINKEGRIDW